MSNQCVLPSSLGENGNDKISIVVIVFLLSQKIWFTLMVNFCKGIDSPAGWKAQYRGFMKQCIKHIDVDYCIILC